MSETLGFIGLGEMGERMCRNLVRKSGCPVVVRDVREAQVAALVADGAIASESVADVSARADTVFLSLPGEAEVRAVCAGPAGLLETGRAGQVVVDLSTNAVSCARELATLFGERGIAFADAPVARTRDAAAAGTLSIMVGADPDTFARIKPWLDLLGTSIAHCGGVGCGEIAKIINNLLVFQNVLAVAEALTLARRAGMDDRVLLRTLQDGSGDSFVLRHHAESAMVPGVFRAPSFGARYVLKDLSYALQLAGETGSSLRGAELAREAYEEAAASAHASEYFPAVIKTIEARATPGADGAASGDPLRS